MRRTVALATLLIAGAATARAQGGRGDTTTRFHVLPALGVQVGTPQKASAALGIVVGEDFVRDGRDHSRNVALFAEPGLSAGRASPVMPNSGHSGKEGAGSCGRSANIYPLERSRIRLLRHHRPNMPPVWKPSESPLPHDLAP